MGQAIRRGFASFTLDGRIRALAWVARWAVVAEVHDEAIIDLRLTARKKP